MWFFVAVFVVALVVAYAMIPKPQNAKPAAFDEFEVPQAQEGGEIGWLFGTRMITGSNLVWYGDLKTQAIRRSKQTIGYYYYLGMHLVLCQGPIDAILVFLADDKVAFAGNWTTGDIVFFKQYLFGGDEKEGGIAGRFSLEQGGPTQTPHAYLVSKLAPNLVPAYRGVTAVIMQQVYVGTTTYLKKMSFLASRIHVRTTDGIAQWYDAKSQVLSFQPEYVLFTENFSNGIADYSLVTGSLAAFVISSDTYGETLTFDSTSAIVNSISRDIPSGFFSGISLKFRLNEINAGDSATIVFRDDLGNLVFSFIPARDSFYDSASRPNVTFVDISGSAGNPIGSGRVTVGTWYALDIAYNQNTGKFDAVISNASTGAVWGSVSTVATIGNKITKLEWTDNEGSASRGAAASFADIEIRSRLQSADMNPAHIIREALTDPDSGMGYQDADIDSTSFTYAADKLFAEGMGMSIIWTKQTAIEDFVKEIARHIDGTVYLDKSDGKFHLKLIRDDYVEASLLTLDPTNIDHISDFTRPTFGELTNSVTVQFWDGTTYKDSSVTVQDIALAQMQGAVVNTTVQYPGFTNANLATRVAQRDLRTISTPIASCTIYANRDAFVLNIGDAFKLTWPDYGINALVMRVTSVAYGDGKTNQIRLTCTQDVYKLPAEAIVIPTAPVWTDPNTTPVAATLRLPYEVPYEEMVQQDGQAAVDTLLTTNSSVGLAGISVGRPTQDTINANMNVDSGGGYLYGATVDFSPTAKLVAAIGKTDTSFSISNEADTNLAPDGTWLQIGNEIMVKVSLVAGVLTVKRGALDTVPETHAINSAIFFWDQFAANSDTQYVSGNNLNIKVTPITGAGELALADAPVNALSIVGRPARPYPPAQFKINGTAYPASATLTAIVPTWVHRDRRAQAGGAILGTADAGVGPEAGTTYTVRYYDDSTNTLLNTESGIAGTTATGYTPVTSLSLRVELESVRGGLTSFQKHSHVLAYTQYYTRITEASDRRITEAGDVRITES